MLKNVAWKLGKRVSTYETAAFATVLKGGKFLATRLMRKKADVEAEME